MRSFFTVGLCLLAFSGLIKAQPTDNPYRTFYNPAGVHFTDSLPWQRTVNIQGIRGATMVERYNMARDSAARMGGGVVYFPEGAYVFEDGLTLVSNVLIRGVPSVVNTATDRGFAPRTRFVFPKYVPTFTGAGTPNSTAFKRIRTGPNVSNSGIVDVDVDHAGISLSSNTFVRVQSRRGNSPRSQEANRNLICMGVRSNHVTAPYGTVPDTGQFKWQRYTSPFASNINGYVYENLVIANNRCNDFENNAVHPIPNLSYPQPGYKARARTGTQYVPVDSGYMAMFSYTDHHGISVNRKETISNAYPSEEPGNFCRGIEIRNNWVFKTMRVGIICSGDGIVVADNIVRDRPGKKAWLHVIGTRFNTNNSSTYENRGIDFGGWHVQIARNDVQVVRHQFPGTPYASVDGEGILMQECCGGTSLNGVSITGNRTGSSYIGLYKLRDIYNVEITGNRTVGEGIQSMANLDGTGGRFYYYKQAYVNIADNVADYVLVDGNRGGRQVVVTRNIVHDSSEVPCYASYTNNTPNGPKFTGLVPTGIRGPLPRRVAACATDGEQTGALSLELVNPGDTLMESNAVLNMRVTRYGNAPLDSLQVWAGARVVDTLPFADSASFVITAPINAKNGTYYLTVSGQDTANRKVFTNRIGIKICPGCGLLATKNRKPAPQLTLAPNPAAGGTIELIITDKVLATNIYTISGQRVKQGSGKQVDVTALNPGLYIVQAQTDKGARFARLVVE